MEIILQKALPSQIPAIWEILHQAIAQRKKDGSTQWQNGYPNEAVVKADIAAGNGFVALAGEEVVAYIAILLGTEIPYNTIEGDWLTNGAYATLHRLAIAEDYRKQGLANSILSRAADFCRQQKVPAIRFDTSADNTQMLRLAGRAGYTYCGNIFQNGQPRLAYEHVLNAF